MKRFAGIFSSCLSFVTIAVFAVSVWGTLYLDGRATWSGAIAPSAWIEAAKPNDVFEVAGREIAYWGDPQAKYSKYATRRRRKPIAVVVHYTSVKPVWNLVNYGHVSDPNRGGASFGYHFYIGRDGSIVQGAPLSRRTNHIKFKTNKQRRETAKYLWSGNTIGVSMIGGCDSFLRPDWQARRPCSDEFVTRAQLEAGLAVVRALQTKFEMKCDAVFGHGDLQFDREIFEGLRLSRLARKECASDDALAVKAGETQAGIVAPKPIAVKGAKKAAVSTRARGG